MYIVRDMIAFFVKQKSEYLCRIEIVLNESLADNGLRVLPTMHTPIAVADHVCAVLRRVQVTIWLVVEGYNIVADAHLAGMQVIVEILEHLSLQP
jgi:hypothetical protein